MEIDITSFFNSANPCDYSASRFELGDNAGRITWQNALEADSGLLDSPEKLEAFRDHVRGFGAWDDAEIAAWDRRECEALFVQMISGGMREAGLHSAMAEEDWQEYEACAQAGEIPSNLFRGDDGRVYYYIGI